MSHSDDQAVCYATRVTGLSLSPHERALMDMQHPHKAGDSVPSFMIHPKPLTLCQEHILTATYSHTSTASTARVLGPVANKSLAHMSDVYTYHDSDNRCLGTPASSLKHNRCAASHCNVRIADLGLDISYCSRQCRTAITSSDDASVIDVNGGERLDKRSRYSVFGKSSEYSDDAYEDGYSPFFGIYKGEDGWYAQ